MEKEINEFLYQSNLIEGVDDDASLKQARVAWDYLVEQKEMSPSVILKTHKILMLNQPLRPNERGYFREIPVYVGGRETLDWKVIEERMKILAMNMWLNPKNWKRHHVEYETIHPFVDGNGRTGRMFMNWERLKEGLPILIINADERHEYYEWFK